MEHLHPLRPGVGQRQQRESGSGRVGGAAQHDGGSGTKARRYRPANRTRPLNRQGHEVARCTIERLMRELGLAGAVRGKKVIHHAGSGRRPGPGPARPGLRRPGPEPDLGRRFQARRGRVGRHLRRVRRGHPLASHRRLVRVDAEGDTTRSGRTGHGAVAARPRRQRAHGVDDRPVQDGSHQAPATLEGALARRARHRRVGHWYNHRRLHGGTGHIPPVEYEANYYRGTTKPQLTAAN
ncbi:IS3 family transposase [Streptomyces sp. CB00316]|uniref:IS3 family transposase n=1 Tax=Streptomyces sp. CB00316 TaxID=1703932 RepID=UPI000A8D0E4A